MSNDLHTARDYRNRGPADGLNAALAELRARRPDRVLETNVEFWAGARTAGWAAHILEQKKTGRLVRPSARYTGPAARPVGDVPGAAGVLDRNL